MPRGRKPDNRTLDEKIAATKTQIEDCQTNLTQLQEKLNDLLKQKDKEEVDKLLDFMHKNGKSVQDIINGIQGKDNNAIAS